MHARSMALSSSYGTYVYIPTAPPSADKLLGARLQCKWIALQRVQALHTSERSRYLLIDDLHTICSPIISICRARAVPYRSYTRKTCGQTELSMSVCRQEPRHTDRSQPANIFCSICNKVLQIADPGKHVCPERFSRSRSGDLMIWSVWCLKG